MEPDFSSCVKKKLERPHMLYGFDDIGQFFRRLKKHRIAVGRQDLEVYEREGWLQPAFRLILPEDLRRGGLLYLGTDAIQQFYADGCVEIPRDGDYEPWDGFKANPKRLGRDRKLLYYHPLQILQVESLLSHKSVSFLLRDSYTKSDIEKIINGMVDGSRRNVSFNVPQTKIANSVGKMMLVEESYGIHVYHKMAIPFDTSAERFMDRWREWRNGFTAVDLLKDCGASVEQIRDLYDWAALRISLLDPLRSWHDLIRIMRPQALEKIEGESLTFLVYRDIAGMLAWFLHELGGKEGEPDMPFDDVDAEWKRHVYSDPFNYRTHKTRQAIVRHFVRDTSTRLYILVEGKTEMKVIEKICERRGISLADEVVMVLDREGIENMHGKNIRWLIRTARKDSIAIYIIADNEANWKEGLENIRREFGGPFGCRIWDTSFEEDNFGGGEVMGLINSHLSASGESLSEEEARGSQQHKKALVSAAEHAYGKKYGKSLFGAMGKTKADFALELTDRFYRNAGADKLEIEKALDAAFAMVTTWT